MAASSDPTALRADAHSTDGQMTVRIDVTADQLDALRRACLRDLAEYMRQAAEHFRGVHESGKISAMDTDDIGVYRRELRKDLEVLEALGF